MGRISLITTVKINWFNNEKYFWLFQSVKIDRCNSELYFFIGELETEFSKNVS